MNESCIAVVLRNLQIYNNPHSFSFLYFCHIFLWTNFWSWFSFRGHTWTRKKIHSINGSAVALQTPQTTIHLLRKIARSTQVGRVCLVTWFFCLVGKAGKINITLCLIDFLKRSFQFLDLKKWSFFMSIKSRFVLFFKGLK